MRRVAALAAAIALAAVLAACQGGDAPGDASPAARPTASSVPGSDLAGAFARELYDRANLERVEEGMEPLIWSDCLAQKAAERAAPFVEDPDLEHDVLTATCQPGASAGENLSRSDRTPAQVVEAWMGSPGHRANILSPAFLISGVGCHQGESGVFACSELFEGRP